MPDESDPSSDLLPHSRVGVAAFVVSLIAAMLPGHLLALMFLGAQVSRDYLVICNWASAALGVAGVVLAVIALFDVRKNRFLGMLGWWLGIIALSTIAIAIRVALRRHILHR